MIIYTTSRTDKDLMDILDLQHINLPANLSAEEIISQGFVTVHHRLDDLKKMNNIEPSIIAKENDRVIAYLLATTKASENDIPALQHMFEKFDKAKFEGRSISQYHYIVVGQVCVAKEYRGKSVLDNCYAAYKKEFSSNYDFAITEIATKNQRSINAHKRIGFTEVYRYFGPNKVEWSIVVWNWDEKNRLSGQ